MQRQKLHAGTVKNLPFHKKVDQMSFEDLEILKAVCVSFDWPQKVIQKSFQTRKQKFVQRWETKVGVDACKAS